MTFRVNLMATKIRLERNFSQTRCRQISLLIILLTIFALISYLVSYISFTRAIIQFDATILQVSSSHPCSHLNHTRLDIGRKHFSQSRVIICGLIRDRENHIKRLKEQLYGITALFADYAIVVVENDSKDRTREELVRWALDDSHVHILGCPTVNQSCKLALAPTKDHVPALTRIQKMVLLRNIYMNYIDENLHFHQFDYLIVEDFDLTTATFLNGVYSTAFQFSRDPTIDAICSNGIYRQQLVYDLVAFDSYFDPYAHKDENNQNWSFIYNDVWSTVFRQYSCNEGLIQVKSCFSGRTIYRYQNVRNKRYRTYLDAFGEPICEHVGFHERMEKIYLNSEMIFYVTKNNVNS